jgi:hypothetical protein
VTASSAPHLATETYIVVRYRIATRTAQFLPKVWPEAVATIVGVKVEAKLAALNVVVVGGKAQEITSLN